MKQLIALLLSLFLMSVSWSQEVEDADETEVEAAEVTAAAEVAAAAEEEMDDAELDEQGYGIGEEEDDFIPSEEVSADQSLTFPVDI